MPRVGVVACHKLDDFRRCVLHAGGEVHVLDPSASITEVFVDIDALLLTSGGDVAPERYGAGAHPSLFDVDPRRDDFEFNLIAEARRVQRPILAVCRGIQVLNVALGGTLIQDIPSQVSGALEHQLTIPPHQPFSPAHEVRTAGDSLLARILAGHRSGPDAFDVNSRHHQAVGKLAPGLRATATAPDDVVEAIEDPNVPFCIGIQWHAENFWQTGEFDSLFEAFVAAGR